MEQLKIPFKLGIDYEVWELYLECLPDRLKGYDSYIYLGKEFNNLLNYPINRIELIFSLDILEALIISFNYMDLTIFHELSNRLIVLFEKPQILHENDCILYKFQIDKTKIWCCYTKDITHIIISDKPMIGYLTSSLLC